MFLIARQKFVKDSYAIKDHRSS